MNKRTKEEKNKQTKEQKEQKNKRGKGVKVKIYLLLSFFVSDCG